MFGRETSFLELAVYVACESEGAVLHEVAPSAEDVESGMRFGLTIKRQAVSVESPRERWVVRKTGWISHVFKR
jgi:hypothetical protein